MPEPQQVHIDAALTNISLAYNNPDFVAELIAPQVPVRKQSDRYYVYDIDREGIRSIDDLRSPGTMASEVDYALSTDSYYCSDHALVSAVTDEERDNADPALQPHIDRTEFLTERVLLNQEVATATALRESTEITSRTLGADSRWDNPDSDPLADMHEARVQVFSQAQRRANLVILPFQVYEVVRSHPAIIDMIKYSGNGLATPQILAQIFDVDRVVVPRAFVNNAPSGQPPAVTPVWGNEVFVAHVAPRAGLKQLSLAHTFVWSGTPGSENGTIVERWRDHARKADMVRVQKYYDVKLVAPAAGFRFSSVVD